MKSLDRAISNIFAENYQYLCNKACGSIFFSIFKKTNNFGALLARLIVYPFDSLVRPVLTYGCAIWVTRSNGREQMDKIHLIYLRSNLGIKASSSNVITLGECGSIFPSATIQAICITYLKRIQPLPYTSLLKQTSNEMKKCITWVLTLSMAGCVSSRNRTILM